MKLTVNASKLKLAATCMAKNDIRFYLNGVSVEPRPEGGVYLVATDGLRMMVVIDETGHADEKCIIRLKKSTREALPKRPAFGTDEDGFTATTVDVDGIAHLAIKNKDGLIVHQQINDSDGLFIQNAKFPDWRHAMKFEHNTTAQNTGAFQLRYLAGVSKAIEKDSKMGLSVRLYSHCDWSQILVHIVNHEYAALVVMPVLADDSSKSFWIRNFTQPSALPEPKRNADIDKALTMAFTALDHLANQGVIARME